MSQIQQILNYVKNINERLNLWVANAKKAEELPVMEIMDPDGLLIVSELVSGVWVSKRLQVQKIIDGLSMADQDNKVREVLLGTITEDSDLDYLLDNNGIIVAANEIIVITVLDTIDTTLVQKQYLWKLGKGEYNPIGSNDISTKLIELQPRFLNEITADELTSSPSAIVYDFGIITDTILDVLNTASPARDYTDDEKIYYIRATKNGVNLLYNFIGINGTYGDGESQMVESDLVLVYSSANTDITVLLNNKLDKGTYTGDAGQLDNRLTVVENFTPTPQSGFTGRAVAVWSGVGLTYNVTTSTYYLDGVLYPAITDSITLDVADGTNPRFDSVIADVSGLNKETGEAEENPAAPTLDPNTQLLITNVLISAGATIPDGVNQNLVYDEGTESEVIAVGSNLTVNNTTDPFNGTKCLDVGYTTASGVYYFEFILSENKKIIDADGFKFFVKFLRNVTSSRGFRIQFFNGSTPVSDKINFIRASASGSTFNSIYGITYNNLSNYQLIYIPYSDLDFTNPEFNKIKIEFTNGVEMKLDYLALVSSGGSASPSPDKKAFSKIITDDGIASATTAEDSVVLTGKNGTEVKAIGKTISIDAGQLNVIWHKFPWTNAGDITISGTTVTSTAGIFEADMVGAKIKVGDLDFIISSYSSATSVQVVSNPYGTVTGPNGSWGVYNKAIEVTTAGSLNLYGTSSNIPATMYSESTMILPNLVHTIGSLIGITADSFQLTSGVPIVWRSGDLATDGSRDVGIRRNAAGVLEVFDGITAGQYRDMVVRHISGATATAPEHYVPLAQMETLLDSKADLVGGLVPSSQLPAYIDDVIEGYKSGADFYEDSGHTILITGLQGIIYIDLTVGQSNKGYRWSGSVYIQITNGLIASTADVPEDSGYLYFTAARVLATILTGLSATAGTFTSFDSLLTAFGKIKYLIDNIATTYQTIAPNVQVVTSSPTVTPVSTNDEVVITAQAANLTLANPTGTFAEGQALIIRIKDNGTSRTITFGSNYRAIGITLPTATTISKTMYLAIIYNNTDSKWDVIGTRLEA